VTVVRNDSAPLDFVRRVGADWYERDRSWCFQMPSGFVVVRRAQRDAKSGEVVAASRATIQGNSYGTNVDMWSLGVLVFVLLGGYMPFSGKTEMQEIRAILGGQYKFDPRRGWDKISASAKNFISNLLLQDPEARFTAAQALQHPWIRGRSLSGRKLSSLPSLSNIRDFQRESKRGREAKKADGVPVVIDSPQPKKAVAPDASAATTTAAKKTHKQK